MNHEDSLRIMSDRPNSRADLTDTWTKRVCKIGQGHACCRYLTISGGGWNCEKHSDLGRYLDQRVAAENMNARGDNCPGLLEKTDAS